MSSAQILICNHWSWMSFAQILNNTYWSLMSYAQILIYVPHWSWMSYAQILNNTHWSWMSFAQFFIYTHWSWMSSAQFFYLYSLVLDEYIHSFLNVFALNTCELGFVYTFIVPIKNPYKAIFFLISIQNLSDFEC